jgi:3-phosphoshikimate 1-carboxyvinyltransferase
LRGITLDCNHIPDAAMTLAVMALYADGPTRLTNIASWRVKETDRIAAMAAELRKVGAIVLEGADFIEVRPPAAWQAASVHTYDDHRMAMCLSLAAFNPLAVARADAQATLGGATPKTHRGYAQEIGSSPPNGERGVPVRIEDPGCVAKTFPDYFEALFSLSETETAAVPVITVDGPSASGKGTLAGQLAKRLGYHQLDSGAIYRAAGVAAQRAGVDLDDGPQVAGVAASMRLRFEGESVFIDGADLTEAVRSESGGMLASRVSALPAVRQALQALQLSFRRAPGLVADGRDMGTVIFPDAVLKIFLTASAPQRALRRQQQLAARGVDAKIDNLRVDLEARDARDRSRSAAPLKAAEDALALDNSGLGIDDTVDLVLGWWSQRRPF